MRFAASSMEVIRHPPRVIHALTACRRLHRYCATMRSRWSCHISGTHGVTVRVWLQRLRSTGAGKVYTEIPGSYEEFARSRYPRKVNIAAEARPRGPQSDHRETGQDRRAVDPQVYPDQKVADLFWVYPDRRGGEDLPQVCRVNVGPTGLSRFENILSWGRCCY